MLIWKQKILRIFSTISGGIILFSLLLVLLNLKRLTPPLIIHFDNFRGVDFFGGKLDIFAIWSTGLLMIVVNTILAEVFFERERTLSYLFIGVNLLLSLLILIISAVIISVN